MMKTEQASKEVAAANMSQQTAARSLQQAEQAEAVVRQESRAVDQVPHSACLLSLLPLTWSKGVVLSFVPAPGLINAG